MQDVYSLMESLEGGLYGVASFVYLMLAVLLLIAWRRSGPGTWLVFACLATTLWAGLYSASYLIPGFDPGTLTLVLESARALAWTGFIFSIFQPFEENRGQLDVSDGASRRLPAVIAILVIALNTALAGLGGGDALSVLPASAAGSIQFLELRLTLHIAASAGILLLLEMLIRQSSGAYRSAIVYLAVALGGQAVFDIVLFADALFSGIINPAFLLARPGVAIIVAPFMFIAASRNASWKLNISMSRRGVIYSFTLIGVGLYLIIMSLAALYVSKLDEAWGNLALTLLLFGAGLFLVALVSSIRVRRWFRRFIAEHFLAYTYDYREEWLKFVRTVSDESREDLQVRIIKAMAGLVDSHGGSLWLADRNRVLMRQENVWGFSGGVAGVEQLESEFSQFLVKRQQVVDLDLFRDGAGEFGGMIVPEWVKARPSAWLAVPLTLRDDLIGMVILERPTGPQSLNWEEQDILRTVAAQSASYISEQKAQAALSEASQFRDFSEKFAFAIHDIKNISSQMGLLVQNAGKHIDKPEFQKDMLSTLGNMTGKMKLLLTRLDDQQAIGLTGASDVELKGFLSDLVGSFSHEKVLPGFQDETGETVWVTVEGEKMKRVIGHLIQNALDAVNPDNGKVRVELARGVQYATIRVRDNGVGMTPEFMARKLFKPFFSTKENGYGLGMVECRRVITRHKGELRVASKPGRGTVMEMRVPLSLRSMEQGVAGGEKSDNGSGDQDKK